MFLKKVTLRKLCSKICFYKDFFFFYKVLTFFYIVVTLNQLLPVILLLLKKNIYIYIYICLNLYKSQYFYKWALVIYTVNIIKE